MPRHDFRFSSSTAVSTSCPIAARELRNRIEMKMTGIILGRRFMTKRIGLGFKHTEYLY
jgi:hypothetical protein